MNAQMRPPTPSPPSPTTTAVAMAATTLSLEELRRRLRQLETVERAESNDLGLRVIIGQRQAIVSTGDLSAASLERLVESGITIARAVPEDRFVGLADPDGLGHGEHQVVGGGVGVGRVGDGADHRQLDRAHLGDDLHRRPAAQNPTEPGAALAHAPIPATSQREPLWTNVGVST